MQPTQPETDFVMLLMGRIATNDGTPIPQDVLVERICTERVRQQVGIGETPGVEVPLGQGIGDDDPITLSD